MRVVIQVLQTGASPTAVGSRPGSAIPNRMSEGMSLEGSVCTMRTYALVVALWDSTAQCDKY